MIQIERYISDRKKEWDDFVSASKTPHLMFYRNFMEYHRDRFEDHSIVVTHNGRMSAIIPGNVNGDVFYSHQGLTFGGIVTGQKMTTCLMLKIFDALLNHLRSEGFRKIVIKRLPQIFHSLPADEDLYALYRNSGRLIKSEISSCIDLKQPAKISDTRKNQAKRAEGKIEITENYGEFWEILEKLLWEKHQKKPTHSLDEIRNLSALFPYQIKLFSSSDIYGHMLAGVVVFESKEVAHTQYMAASDQGKECFALDAVLSYVIDFYQRLKPKKYLNFGISTEQDGQHLNEGLIFYKESFGGKAVVHETFEVCI